MLRAVPREARAALGALPVTPELRLDVLPHAALIARIILHAVHVGRTVVVERLAVAHVGTRLVVLAPIRLFDGGIDLLGDALAGEPAHDGAHGCADRRADRSGDGACRRAGRDAARGSTETGADGVRARRAGDGITIGTALVFVTVHERSSDWCSRRFEMRVPASFLRCGIRPTVSR